MVGVALIAAVLVCCAIAIGLCIPAAVVVAELSHMDPVETGLTVFVAMVMGLWIGTVVGTWIWDHK